eukprot:3623286-Prymnesium_polylepis.1
MHGFPLWEREVFQLLQRSFVELASIFTFYAMSGTAGSSTATAALSMQQTELGNLAMDIGLTTEAFPMARVQNIFARADQEDAGSNQVASHGLELHEFLEALVLLAFHRANPQHGEVGRSQEVAEPLPGCLEALLDKQLLKRAKRDKLARIKVALMADE